MCGVVVLCFKCLSVGVKVSVCVLLCLSWVLCYCWKMCVGRFCLLLKMGGWCCC